MEEMHWKLVEENYVLKKDMNVWIKYASQLPGKIYEENPCEIYPGEVF